MHQIKALNKASHEIYIFNGRLKPILFENNNVFAPASINAQCSYDSGIKTSMSHLKQLALPVARF